MNDPVPCDYCGEAPDVNYFDGARGAWWQVQCQGCLDRTGFYRTRDEAVAAWNGGGRE